MSIVIDPRLHRLVAAQPYLMKEAELPLCHDQRGASLRTSIGGKGPLDAVTRSAQRPVVNLSRSTKWQVRFLLGLFTVLWVIIVAVTGCSTVPALRGSGERNTGAVVTETKRTAADTQFALSKPSRSQPVKAAMRTTPTEVRAGGTFEILVRLEIGGSYHIYASNVVGKPFIPISLNMRLPGGIEASGDWIAPVPDRTRAGELIYTDSVSFRRSLKVRSNVPAGPLSIRGELRYQACTEELCWPPCVVELSSSVTVSSPKRLSP